MHGLIWHIMEDLLSLWRTRLRLVQIPIDPMGISTSPRDILRFPKRLYNFGLTIHQGLDHCLGDVIVRDTIRRGRK